MSSIDFGTNKKADKASLDLQKKSKCKGNCGKSYNEVLGHWSNFIALDNGDTCMSPEWSCDDCFEKENLENFKIKVLQLKEKDKNRAMEIYYELKLIESKRLIFVQENKDFYSNFEKRKIYEELIFYQDHLFNELSKMDWPNDQITVEGPVIH